MLKKATVIVVEDDHNWLSHICEILKKYFDTNIENFSSFRDAGERISQQPENFDLLITDLFLNDSASGLELANFVTKPVIIVTAYSKYVGLKDNKFENIFEKGGFEKIDFINSVSKIIRTKSLKHNKGKQDFLYNTDPQSQKEVNLKQEEKLQISALEILHGVSNQNLVIPVMGHGNIVISELVKEVEMMTDKGRAFIKLWAQSTKMLKK